jgi:hypothetical protein
MLRVHESYPALYSGLMQRIPFFLCALFMCSVVLQAQESGPDFETVYQTVTIDHDEVPGHHYQAEVSWTLSSSVADCRAWLLFT